MDRTTTGTCLRRPPMSTQKIKASWWVEFRWKGSRYRRRSPLNTRAGAVQFESLLRQELAITGSLEALDAKAKKPMTPVFADFADRWMNEYVMTMNKPSEQRSKRTVLRAHLIPAFGSRRLDEIKTADIDQYASRGLTKGHAPKTVNNHLIILRRCLATAIEWDIPLQMPRIHPLRVPPQGFRFLPPEKIDQIVQCADEPWRTMIALAADTGLRFSELIALDWSDVDFAARRLTVRRGCVKGIFDSPKNNRVRHMRLTAEAVAALDALPHRTGLLFTHNGKVINDETARRHLAIACRLAGIEPIGWHVLRHSFASELARRGASIYSIKELLGHCDVQVTMRYAHLAQSSLDDSVLLLERRHAYPAGVQPTPVRVLLAPAVSQSFFAQTTENVAVDRDVFCGSEGGDRTHGTLPAPNHPELISSLC